MTGAVIFDLDGIVVDTVPIHFRAWQKMFNEYGKEFTFKDYKDKVDGIPRINGATAILTDLSEKEIEEASLKKQEYFRELLDQDSIPVYQSTIRLIKQLKENNIPRAVISSSKNCIYILKKIGVYNLLNTVIDGNMITKGKPHPQIFLIAAEELKVKPENCIVFEDAILGIQAAKTAGMFGIGVDRYKNPQRLSKADLVITDISDITLEKLVQFKPN